MVGVGVTFVSENQSFCLHLSGVCHSFYLLAMPQDHSWHQLEESDPPLARFQVNKTTVVWLLFLVFALTLLAGCGGSSSPKSSEPPTPAPLSAGNLNLIFVVSEDLAYQASGDVNPSTANLTNQGLQRSLLMATFLQQKVLGMQNVTGIYALEPMTHLQTANNYPDMVGLETIQQFAMLNQITLSSDQSGGTPLTGHSYPINASYA